MPRAYSRSRTRPRSNAACMFEYCRRATGWVKQNAYPFEYEDDDEYEDDTVRFCDIFS